MVKLLTYWKRYKTLEKVCDKCSDYEPRLGDIQNMLVFPDLTSPQGKFMSVYKKRPRRLEPGPLKFTRQRKQIPFT